MGVRDGSSDGCSSYCRIACRDDTPFDGPQGSQRLERGIFAIALVPIEDHRGAPLLRNGNRDDLIIELAVAPGSGRTLMGPDGISIGLLPGDPIVAGQDRKSTRLTSSHSFSSRMLFSA